MKSAFFFKFKEEKKGGKNPNQTVVRKKYQIIIIAFMEYLLYAMIDAVLRAFPILSIIFDRYCFFPSFTDGN